MVAAGHCDLVPGSSLKLASPGAGQAPGTRQVPNAVPWHQGHGSLLHVHGVPHHPHGTMGMDSNKQVSHGRAGLTDLYIHG